MPEGAIEEEVDFSALSLDEQELARMEMMEKLMAKLENPDQERFSSCLYPILASSCSSRDRAEKSTSATTSSSPMAPSGTCISLSWAAPRPG